MTAPSRPSSLWVLDLMYEALEELAPMIEAVARRNRDLADQLVRAATSVALNLEESNGVSGGNRRVHRERARGSLYESKGALRCAIALGYVEQSSAKAIYAKLDRIGSMIYGLLGRP